MYATTLLLASLLLYFITISAMEPWPAGAEEQADASSFEKSGFDSETGIYTALVRLGDGCMIPNDVELDTAKFVLSKFPPPKQAESRTALIDSATNRQLSYAELHRSIGALATGLYHLGIRKGDVVFVVSPNSLLFPAICLAIFSVGAILCPANPINTESEILKQVKDSGAKYAISDPGELHKLKQTGVLTLVTTCQLKDENSLSVDELIENCDPFAFPRVRLSQSDTAAILYSSGTTGKSKGVILTHANFIAIMTTLSWCIDVTSAQNDIFLCFIPMFHIYGLAFFGLGLFCSGVTTVVMQRFDFKTMLDAIQAHQVTNIPAVPPVLLGLVKYGESGVNLASLRRVGVGAAPMSKELSDAFRSKFPWVELRPGYGLTESCGGATFFVSNEDARRHPASCGTLLPTFYAKIVDIESEVALPPYKKGEVWLTSPTIMKGYLGNMEATATTLTEDRWLRTGDLGYFDDEGYLYVVDRIKELIKHNGYQVAPAELEDILVSHPNVLDAAVIPAEDEEAGQIPVAYVVRAAGSDLTADQVMQFVASQVAPYKKVRRVKFIDAIPKSAAGKILRKELVSQRQEETILSKL